MHSDLETLSQIAPSERVLLLPHCLRLSSTCQATYDQQGLQCQQCSPDCPVNRLRQAASEWGYQGICVAPGGRLALKYIEEARPKAIVAVACDDELAAGIAGVRGLETHPVIVVIPLAKDGCVDTDMDVENGLKIIGTGCRGTAK